MYFLLDFPDPIFVRFTGLCRSCTHGFIKKPSDDQHTILFFIGSGSMLCKNNIHIGILSQKENMHRFH